jgi:hypothetical protein
MSGVNELNDTNIAMSVDDVDESSSTENVSSDRNRRGKYLRYKIDDLEAAIRRVNDGEMTQRKACQVYGIPSATLSRKVNKKQMKNVGHPTVFTKEQETEMVVFLNQVASWGYPIGYDDLRMIIKGYLDKRELIQPRFKNNCPGNDFIRSFIRRNKLSARRASNIRVARSSVSAADIRAYFDNVGQVLASAPPRNVFNYDETCFKDDPGEKVVIVSRGTRRVEQVREASKCTFSVMCCGSAEGQFLPPMVVYKAKFIYDSWQMGGPNGSVYECSDSGW